jgi:5'-methylthioadenosine phosphorylase
MSASLQRASSSTLCERAAPKVVIGRPTRNPPDGYGPAVIGVIGGTGFVSLVRDGEQVEVETPYGSPSAPVTVGEVGGARVAFLPRHGVAHELPPHRIPYRANLWGLRELGVTRIVAANASGALSCDLEVGDFVLCDQFVDRTSGRADTFYDGPETTHVAAGEPFCPELRQLLAETCARLGIRVRDAGTVVTIQGPRFSSRAESEWFAAMGWDVVNMTVYPECHLARELELCYANISTITDYDAGVAGVSPASADEIVAAFRASNERLRELLLAAVPAIDPSPAEHLCTTALRGARI